MGLFTSRAARIPQGARAVVVGGLLGALGACASPSPVPRTTAPEASVHPSRSLDAATARAFTAVTRFAPFFAPVGRSLTWFDPMEPDTLSGPVRACLTASKVSFEVGLANGGVQPRAAPAVDRRVDPLPPGVADPRLSVETGVSRLVSPLAHGWLVALRAAGRSGEIWWVHPGGRPTLLTAATLVDLAHTRHGVVAAVGQGYVTSEYGKLLLLTPRKGGPPRWTELADLGEAPRALFIEAEGTILVATPRALLRVDPRRPGALPETVHRGQWLSLHPNSIARDTDGTIFLGMRYGVVRLTPSKGGGFHEDWLLPRSCLEDDDPACACLARIRRRKRSVRADTDLASTGPSGRGPARARGHGWVAPGAAAAGRGSPP